MTSTNVAQSLRTAPTQDVPLLAAGRIFRALFWGKREQISQPCDAAEDPGMDGMDLERRPEPPRVVIVGAGFGGLAVARGLSRAPVQTTIIDRRNYHLFQPLLYQVATAGLSPADIAAPIRGIVRSWAKTSVLLDRVDGVDLVRREVMTESGARIGYDYLVIATGARHAYFGHNEWEVHAPGLKKIEDATDIRRRILLAFERAESAESESERRALLTFIIVGGGPTGVEMSGAIAELARKALARDFRRIDPRAARILLVEAGPRLLPSFAESLSDVARSSLLAMGVDVRLGTPVTKCDETGVSIGEEHVPARTLIWAAGVAASAAARWLGAEKDRLGRVVVTAGLTLPGREEVFVIGDTACVRGRNGMPLPGIAPVAKQQGAHVARRIKARVANRPEVIDFRYRDLGNLATIGRKSAVVQLGRVKLSGFPAWMLWSVAHVYFLIGFRNRIVVALTWLWAYLTFQRGSRLITGS